MSSPLVIIDDRNPSIQYSGPWFEIDTLLFSNELSTLGSPYQNTLHGVNVSASCTDNVSATVQAYIFLSAVCLIYLTDLLSSPLTLSSVSGSEVVVYGTSITTNASGTQVPTWECFIDGISIGGNPSSSGSSTVLGALANENNWMLCGPTQFHDGLHLLTVNANVSNQHTFWFDQIQYALSASVSLNQPLLRINATDSAIQYSPIDDWQRMNVFPLGLTILTTVNGSTITYQFSGTSESLEN
jgi:hypothetical protein